VAEHRRPRSDARSRRSGPEHGLTRGWFCATRRLNGLSRQRNHCRRLSRVRRSAGAEAKGAGPCSASSRRDTSVEPSGRIKGTGVKLILNIERRRCHLRLSAPRLIRGIAQNEFDPSTVRQGAPRYPRTAIVLPVDA